MDSDLADAVETLKAIFAKRKLPCSFSKAPPATIDDLRKQLRVPSRYRSFLLAANPEKVETVTPVERIRLIPAEEIVKAQALVQTPGASGAAPLDWKASWVVDRRELAARRSVLPGCGQARPRGRLPRLHGDERTGPLERRSLAASSFAQFLRILSTAMEIAAGFGDAIMDDEDEDSFREALGPKVKMIDAAALRAGHWT